jgi:Bacterial Ig domain/Beta-propeller repeat/Viral BACON domain/Putative binding domain, N-terminal
VVRKLSISFFLIANACLAAAGSPLPFSFERFGAEEKFVSRAPGFNLLVGRDEAVFALDGRPGAVIHVSLEGASAEATVTGEEQFPGRANYFVGRDPSNWRTNVEQFGRVRVREVLPHTDIVYYGNPKQPEYDLVLRPGADVAKIRLRFTGVTPEIQPNGDLLMKTAAGEIIEHRPVIEQGGKPIDGRFRIMDDGSVGFNIKAYDLSKELRIDPSITYSTYLGGTSEDSPNAIATDASGNAYITGSTSSFNFPVSPGALQNLYPGTFETIAFVAKLNAAGTGLVYATFLGGSGIYAGDSANAIAVDGAGNAYVGGTTGSTNFPVTAGAVSTTLGGSTDGFVAKINASGTALIYSTFLGGSGQESVAGIALDASGDAFVTGSTSSINFPVTTGAPQTALKSANDAFVAKLNPAGAHLLYSTYLGGSTEDDGYAIAVDGSGNAYVAGTTASVDFPVTTGTYKKTIGPATVAFVAKVNPAGTALTYATFLGGTGGDAANAIALDSAGDAYVAGTTYSADFPTTAGVVTPNAPGISSFGHGFVSKLNPAGAALLYSTYLGGGSSDGANGLAIDTSGDAIITGYTNSTNFPVSANSADPVANYSPAAFVSKLNPAATALLYSTLLGASGSTVGQAIAVDAGNHVYIAGYTNATTLPTSSGAFQITNAASGPGASTGFLMKLDLGSATSCTLSFSPTSANLPVAGGSTTTSVTVPAGCAWEAIAGSTWFTVNPPSSGVGPGSITVNAGSNGMSLSSRSASLAAGGATFTLTQSAGSCTTPQFYPASQTFAAAGGTGSVAVAIPAGCAVTAVSNAAWITVNGGASSAGDDLVTFTVAAGTGTRSGSITIAGIAYSITQFTTSCVTSLTLTNSSIPAAGGSFPAILVAPAGCAWTATTTASWLTVSPTNGTGSATLTLSGAANNTGSTLTANVTSSGFSYPVVQQSNTPPMLYVDGPAAGATVSGSIPVSGWAIDNSTAIASVQVAVDGSTVGNATYGSTRVDVCAAFPGRPGCPNVGFVYSLNTSTLSPGSHTITVTAKNSGSPPGTVSTQIPVTVPLLTPLTYADVPAPGAVLTGTVTVFGWALGGSTAISKVQVKVDGTVVGNATYGSNRGDACGVYPGRPACPNVGFSYSLNVSLLSAGPHTLTLVATDSSATPLTASWSIPFTVAGGPPSVYADNPAPGAMVSGITPVSGWAVDSSVSVGSPIAGLVVKVDGNIVGNATYGSPRPDVCAIFPGRPNCPNVGFVFPLDTSTLTPGNHTVSVLATNTDAVPASGSSSVNFMVLKPPTVYIDSPVPGSTVTGTLNMGGWAINNAATIGSAISGVQVQVDGITVGNAAYGGSRPDVCAAFPGRPNCPNVGFTYSLNTSTLSPGTHTISVVATSSDATPIQGSASVAVIK